MIFDGFANGRIDKLAKMAGVMHEADHAYSIDPEAWNQKRMRSVMEHLQGKVSESVDSIQSSWGYSGILREMN